MQRLMFACLLVQFSGGRHFFWSYQCCDNAAFLSLSSVLSPASARGCLRWGLLVVLLPHSSKSDRWEAVRWLPGALALLSWSHQSAGWHRLGNQPGKRSGLYGLQNIQICMVEMPFNASLGGIIIYVNSRCGCEYWYWAVCCKSGAGWVSPGASRQVCPTCSDACALTSSLLLLFYICQPILWLHLPSPRRKNDPHVNCCWYSSSSKWLSNAAVTGRARNSVW